MAKYQYVDAADKLQTVEAASSEAALAAAKNIGKSSGVMLVPPKVDKVNTSTDAGKLGNSSVPNVPPATQSGSAADLAYSIGSSMPGVSDAKNAAAAFAPTAGPIETSYAELVRSMQQDISSIAGKSRSRAELLQTEGVNANKELINRYTQQLQQEQRALSKTTSALYEGEAGFMTSGYADKKAQDIQRRSLSKQADIAIAANAAQGNIEAALEIVDQKLQVKYGEAEDRLALQKQYIDLLSPLMSAEQQRTATARQNELSLYAADLNNKRDLEKMDYQAKLQRQQAAYEASLVPPARTVSFDGGSGDGKNLDLWAENVAGLTGGNTEKGREKVLNDIANAQENGGGPAAANLIASRYISSRDKREQDSLVGAEQALTQMKALDKFYEDNPDFDINYFTKKLSDVSGYFGGKDPKTVEFLAIRNRLDSALRVADTGLSLTGYELSDSQQRFYSDSDNLDNYKTKTAALKDNLVSNVKNEFDRGVGSGFFETYASGRPWSSVLQGSSGGPSVDAYDDLLKSLNL
jgi:hypothetical protein